MVVHGLSMSFVFSASSMLGSLLEPSSTAIIALSLGDHGHQLFVELLFAGGHDVPEL